MKKILFLAAASAFMLTACTSDDLALQDNTQQAVENQAVGFDVYVPNATTTRAGYTGTLNTNRLQKAESGFGVYAFYTDQDTYSNYAAYIAASKVPNFMVNEKITWNATNQGWAYSPLKYWPNETLNDSQTDPALTQKSDQRQDELTFFAYAPYVNNGVAGQPGITAITQKDGKIGDISPEPSVAYKAAFTTNDGTFANTDPNKGVDLLWGVAPAGGMNYTAVNGNDVSKAEGMPLIDMVKPDVNTSMKFLFEHALARFGVKVAAAIDQVPQGGSIDDATKVTVNSVKLTGYFGETGRLNLDNTLAHVANWQNLNGVELEQATTLAQFSQKTIVITGENIAKHLRYQGAVKQTNVGVTTAKQDLIAPTTTQAHYSKVVATAPFDFDPAKIYYDENYAEAHATYKTVNADRYYTKAGDEFTLVESGTNMTSPDYAEADMANYWTVAEEAAFNGSNLLSAETTHDAASAAAYNAGLTGALSTTALTDEQATAYNAAMNGTKAAGDVLSEIEANNYNATLNGAVSAGDVKTPAIYGYDDNDLSTTTKLYTRAGDGVTTPYSYTLVGTKTAVTWEESNTTVYYTLTGTQVAINTIPFQYAAGTYYVAERNFFMVVPTNNVPNICTDNFNKEGTDPQKANEEALRTIDVEIEYYVTTEDSKLNDGRSQVKNVVTKTVVLPHLKNGQSYNLNLLLGLTSVKVEAEVDDWKVTNVQVDLPQNTDGE